MLEKASKALELNIGDHEYNGISEIWENGQTGLLENKA